MSSMASDPLGAQSGPPRGSKPMTLWELADAYHRMHSGSAICYPNPVDAQMRQVKQPFLESRTTLVIKTARAGRDGATFEREVLQRLKHGQTISVVYMEPVHGGEGSGDDDDPVFDMRGFSAACAAHLPVMKELRIQHMAVKNLALTPELSSLRSLRLVDPQTTDGVWDLRLPLLEKFAMENHTPPVKNFAQFLKGSPRIVECFSHKYWNAEDLPALLLPSCKRFTFRRGDCTSKLRLYLPKVEELALDACYELGTLDLLTHAQARKAGLDATFEGTGDQSSFVLSTQHANLGRRVASALGKSGRVLNPEGLEPDSEDQFGFGGAMECDSEGEESERKESESEEGMDEEEEEEEDEDDDAMGGRNVGRPGGSTKGALPFRIGDRVRVVRLEGRPELVGQVAKVVAFPPNPERACVRFPFDPDLFKDGSATEFSIRKANLEPYRAGEAPELD